MTIRQALVLAVMAAGMVACSGGSNVRPPTELTEIVPSVQVQQLWSTGIGDGAGDSGVRLRPAFADGHLYVASVDGDLVALDAGSGSKLWSHGAGWRDDADTSYSGGPGAADGLVVVGTLNGHVYAFEADTGKQRWQATVSSEVITPPVIVGQRVLVRTNDGHIASFDSKTGDRQWIYDRSTVPALSLRGNGPMLVAHGGVFLGGDDGQILALNLENGATLWQQNIAEEQGRTEIERLNDADGGLTLDGSTLFATAYHGHVSALAAQSGQAIWDREISSYTGVAASGKALVVVDDTADVIALDKASGQDIWKQEALKWRWLSAPAVQDNTVVVGDLEGYVHWLSLDDGSIVARQRLSHAAIRSQPLVVGDVAYVEDSEGEVGAYRISR